MLIIFLISLGEKSIEVEKDIPRILWKIKESIPQMLHQRENFGEGEKMLTLGYGSKNSDVFLGKGLREGSEAFQKVKMVWSEGGSCSFNKNGKHSFVVLDMVLYRVEDLLEIEPLVVHPMVVING